jgi:hypothetical protein
MLTDAVRQRFAAFGIALAAGSRATVTVITPNESWSITDQDIGQIYPIAANGPNLNVSRQVFGGLSRGLAEEAGYGLEDGYWWNRGEVSIYFTPPAQFYCLSTSENLFAAPQSPLRAKTILTYDSATLFITGISHWLDEQQQNVTRADIDYQVGLPARVVDPNLVTSEALYDPLGRLIATSMFKGRATSRSRIMSCEVARPSTMWSRAQTSICSRPRHSNSTIRWPGWPDETPLPSSPWRARPM